APADPRSPAQYHDAARIGLPRHETARAVASPPATAHEWDSDGSPHCPLANSSAPTDSQQLQRPSSRSSCVADTRPLEAPTKQAPKPHESSAALPASDAPSATVAGTTVAPPHRRSAKSSIRSTRPHSPAAARGEQQRPPARSEKGQPARRVRPFPH